MEEEKGDDGKQDVSTLEKNVEEKELQGSTKIKDEPPPLPTASATKGFDKSPTEDDGKLLLFPAGGGFNAKRKTQDKGRKLLQQYAMEYKHEQGDKRLFVKEKILSQFPNGIYFEERDGKVVELDEDRAFILVSQKLRDVYNKTMKPKSESSKVKAGEPTKEQEEEYQLAKRDYLARINALKSEIERLRKSNSEQRIKIKDLENSLHQLGVIVPEPSNKKQRPDTPQAEIVSV